MFYERSRNVATTLGIFAYTHAPLLHTEDAISMFRSRLNRYETFAMFVGDKKKIIKREYSSRVTSVWTLGSVFNRAAAALSRDCYFPNATSGLFSDPDELAKYRMGIYVLAATTRGFFYR